MLRIPNASLGVLCELISKKNEKTYDSNSFRKEGGQHLPECQRLLSVIIIFTLNPIRPSGGQYDPDYPSFTQTSLRSILSNGIIHLSASDLLSIFPT